MKGNIREDLVSSIMAGYSHIYVRTSDMDRATRFIHDTLKEYGNGTKFNVVDWSLSINKDPMSSMDDIDKAEPRTAVILKNFNWCLDPKSPVGNFSYDIMQRIQDKLSSYRSKDQRKIMIILSNQSIETGLPSDVRDLFLPLYFARPTDNEILEVLNFVMDSAKAKYGDKIKDLTDEEKVLIVQAAKGMTLDEIENAFSYSFVKAKRVDPLIVTGIKAKMLEKVAGIEYGEYSETFSSLKGYENLKQFVLATINSPLSKGILLTGPPGCGKSHFCKCLGNETGMAVLSVEFANIFGSFVGETYERMGALIDIIRSMGRCIVFADEMEKGMEGMGGNGGVTSNEITVRAMSMWLKFMSEPRECYIIGTCNNVDAFKSAPEYIRAGRWDCAPFYIGLPNDSEKKQIIKFYSDKFKVKGNLGKSEGWSGAEIEQVCRNAAMMGTSVDEAKKFIIPISKIMGDKIGRLEEWAKENAIPASEAPKIPTVKMRRDIDF